jgi:pimeloyl-ACP methyl ester carboxylesterase
LCLSKLASAFNPTLQPTTFAMFRNLLCFLFTGATFYSASGQANLAISSNTLQTSTLGKGDHLRFNFTAKNTGNRAANKSVAGIYVSKTFNITAASVLVNSISIPALVGGQEAQPAQYIFPLPYTVGTGTNYVIIRLDAANEIAETDESNDFALDNTITVSAQISGQQNLPYPIIFVHGLNSEYKVWNEAIADFQKNFGWSNGGNMNFCLNQDGNLATSNKVTDYKDWTDMATLRPADLYTVNFSVNTAGQAIASPNALLSNQSAIVKQGLAMRDAIAHVLQITGRDKVILVGHSMGGLASREYLQNSDLWQPDAQHHVAKIFTIGTPHGGSNSSTFGIGVQGLDERSEAVRDLRVSYTNGKTGAYLFDGVENTSHIYNLFTPYYNVDVNCNGVTGNTIVGLNKKAISTNLAYACVIGTGSSIGGGDGVVEAPRANLKNYYPALAVDTFISIAEETIWHTRLTKLPQLLIKGMDEPGADTLAYGIVAGKVYFGNLSVQSKGATAAKDRDAYSFSLPIGQLLNIKLYNIPLSNVLVEILDEEQQAVYSTNTAGKSALDITLPMNAGNYILAISGTAESTAKYYPYAFELNLAGDGICPGSNTFLYASVSGSSYQWQVNTGNGFININDDAVYVGSHTATLQLTAPPTSWRGYLYRCIVDESNTSDSSTLLFAANWTGAIDDTWENPLNWGCGILPDEFTDVVIKPGLTRYPVINSAASCYSLKALPTTTVSINEGANLIIKGK